MHIEAHQLTGRHRGCSRSSGWRRPPSYGQSSEPHQADGNSTETVCHIHTAKAEHLSMLTIHVKLFISKQTGDALSVCSKSQSLDFIAAFCAEGLINSRSVSVTCGGVIYTAC